MINTQDQEELLRLIADYLQEDLTCVAIGGTAMMFLGYKTTTKDIDLVFKTEQSRRVFVHAIEQIGYKEKSLVALYDEKKRGMAGKPKVYSRSDERFDLFVKSVFGYDVDFDMTKIVQRMDFLGKHELNVFVLPKEELILLKALTRRDKDHEDMVTIIKAEKAINWDHIVDMAISQRKNHPWILIDFEEAMQNLKKITFIPSMHFDKIYKAQHKRER